jgi:CBS domain-containing protein
MILVKDHMTSNPVYVTTEESLGKARSLLRKYGYRSLPVLDAQTKKLAGIISRGDVLKVTSRKTNLQVKGLMHSNVITAAPGDDLMKVARVLVSSGVRQVPVVDASRSLVGILSSLDVLGAFIENRISPMKKRVKDVMSVDVVSCSPDDNVSKVWEHMQSSGYGGMPVLEKNKVVGIITRMDLLTHSSASLHKESGKNKHIPVRKVMQPRVVTVYPQEETQAVAELMASGRIIRVPVIETGMKLAGIVDIQDVLRAYLP